MAGQAGARYGPYGIVFSHISTVEEAANAVGACRYPRLKSAEHFAPWHPRRWADHRGALLGLEPSRTITRWWLQMPGHAQSKWARSSASQDRDQRRRQPRRYSPRMGAASLHSDRRRRPLADPRLSPAIRTQNRAGMDEAHRRHLQEAQCRGHTCMCRAGNAERIVKEGYRFLMCAPVQSYGHFEAARKFTGRS